MTAALPDWKGAIQSTQVQSATSIRNIVLPLDGNNESLAAVPVACKLAELYGATLHLMSMGDQPFDIHETATRLGLARAVFEQGSDRPVDVVTRLTRELPDALLVTSTALGQQVHNNRFGGITEAIFQTKPNWAVLVNPEFDSSGWMLRQILLAHDGTPVSDPATGPAADLARRAEAEVIALHVAARGEERPEAPGSIAAPLYVDQPQHEWPAWAEEFMNRVIAGGAPPSGVHFKLAVTGGQAGSEVAEVARERHVDLVVMAWHGHWDHKDCATRVVIRNAGCPVMLVYSVG